MKHKGAILAVVILGIYAWLTWPKNNKTEEANNDTVSLSKKAKSVHAVETKSLIPTNRIVRKNVPHKKEVTPITERRDPDAVLDHRLKTEQEVILSKGYGTFPAVDQDNNNPHKEYLAKALQDPKNNSGAISIIGKREKFNLNEYQADPSKYLNSIAPGRVFDAAIPAKGVKALERVGYSTMRTKQNQPVGLTAKGEVGMPISFTAFDGGHFQNGLNSITLKADSSGVATAEFTPTQGVINQTRVRAASPVNTGTLQWTIRVGLKEQITSNKGQD